MKFKVKARPRRQRETKRQRERDNMQVYVSTFDFMSRRSSGVPLLASLSPFSLVMRAAIGAPCPEEELSS
jgi:hypothetical protein